jgi:hypothetical protein
MDELEIFNDVIDLFGGDNTDTDDGFIYYGELKLSVAPKVSCRLLIESMVMCVS